MKKEKIKKTNKVIKIVLAFIFGGLLAYKVGVYAAGTIASSNVPYTDTYSLGATTVQGAIDKLYSKVKNCPTTPFELGDYFTLTPTKTTFSIPTTVTGYSSAQTINPSELTLWRVIDIHGDGSVDAVSEYVSSTNIYFYGTTGYANLVGGLQTIATQYAKAGYTINTRMMGYGGQTPTIADTSAFDGTTNAAPLTSSTGSPTTGTGQEYLGGVGGDTLYLSDYQLVSNVYSSDTTTYGSTGLKAYAVNATTTATSYWLTSRIFIYNSENNFAFCVHSVSDYGGYIGTYLLRSYGGSHWDDYSFNHAVRPIITLKSGVTVSGGSGTKTSPYTLS